MASCNVQDLFSASGCFACLPYAQLEQVKTALLCQILQTVNPMATCDVQSLLNSASCFQCIPSAQLSIIQTQLLCELLHAGGTGGESCVFCGDSDPVGVPACTCALAYNRVASSLWYWSNSDLTWYPLIN
jgi:hypothetical protein